jgi:hypothetical protein
MPLMPLMPLVLAAKPAPKVSWKRLYVGEATASSYLKSNWNKFEENYHPSYAFDDDHATAWVEGRDGLGIGESLRFKISEQRQARALRLVIWSGYQKSPKLFAANGRPKALTARLLDAGEREVAKLKLTVADVGTGGQDFVVPVPKGKAVREIELEIDEVFPGASYTDTCIADVEVYADGDDAYKPDAEKAKLRGIKAWAKERLERAKTYAALPSVYPFAAPAYVELPGFRRVDLGTSKPGTMLSKQLAQGAFTPNVSSFLGEPQATRIQALAKTMREQLGDKKMYRAARKQKFPPPEISSVFMRDLMDVADLDQVTFFGTDQATAQMPLAKGSQAESHAQSAYRVRWKDEAAKTVDTLAFRSDWAFMERSVYHDRADYIVVYAGASRPKELLGIHADSFEGGESLEYVTFETGPQEKIGKMRTWTVQTYADGDVYASGESTDYGPVVSAVAKTP